MCRKGDGLTAQLVIATVDGHFLQAVQTDAALGGHGAAAVRHLTAVRRLHRQADSFAAYNPAIDTRDMRRQI